MTIPLGLGDFIVISTKGNAEKRSKPLSYKAAVAREEFMAKNGWFSRIEQCERAREE